MSERSINILGVLETLLLARDAKIVSFRWDLIPWCLALDLDVPAAEDVKDPPTKRGWFIFVGVSEISWSVERARLPNGVFSTEKLSVADCASGFREYQLSLLAPMFSPTGGLVQNPHSKMKITAKEVLGAMSSTMSQFGEFGPDRQQREALASENQLLDALGDVWKAVQSDSGPLRDR